MELTINGKKYEFKGTIGFLRKVNKRTVQTDQNGAKKEVGLTYLIAGIMDGEVEDLIVALDLLNDGQDIRLTKEEIENYIVSEDVDIEKLFDEVLDFLSKANVSKVAFKKLQQRIAENQAH